MTTKRLNDVEQLQQQIRMLDVRREQLQAVVEMTWKPDGDWAVCAAAHAELAAVKRTLEGLRRQLEAASYRAGWANQTPADELAAYQARRQLEREITQAGRPGGAPLMIAEVEQIADLVTEQRLSIEDAIDRVLYGEEEDVNSIIE